MVILGHHLILDIDKTLRSKLTYILAALILLLSQKITDDAGHVSVPTPIMYNLHALNLAWFIKNNSFTLCHAAHNHKLILVNSAATLNPLKNNCQAFQIRVPAPLGCAKNVKMQICLI